MNHSAAKSLRERLLEQLTFFGEQRIPFIDSYFPPHQATALERKKASQLLDSYTSTVESLLAALPEHNTAELPKVLIGSKVTLLYEADQTEESLTICLPEQVDVDSGRISFLSPIGRQILMVSRHEKVSLETPMGKQDVIVQQITFDDW